MMAYLYEIPVTREADETRKVQGPHPRVKHPVVEKLMRKSAPSTRPAQPKVASAAATRIIKKGLRRGDGAR